ncbi:MAG: hypothetical protein M3Z14_03270, partial [Candidatus Eremiobacteraeota bacterium]|nr:hypothetical protein [Candidatus Eremiobacteraeota bacterium]
AAQMHEKVGAHLSKNVDVVLVGGKFADEFARGARETGFPASKIIPFQTNAQAVSWLRTNTTRSDVVLLKGSRIYKLEEIVEGLRADA